MKLRRRKAASVNPEEAIVHRNEFMDIFKYMTEHGHEQLIFRHDQQSGLKAIISIHDSSPGVALGGVRYKAYASEEEAIIDALRLSEAMTYKFAGAGLNHGGAKAVIIKHEGIRSRKEVFKSFGRLVESLQGRFGTGEDVGTNPEDMAVIATETKHVFGIPEALGGEGDPSPITALGVYQGIRAGLEEAFGSDRVAGKVIAIQGCGNVGRHLARYLHEQGGRLVVSDLLEEQAQQTAKEFNATVVNPEQIYEVACDVFAPCALGAILNDRTIPRLKCRIVGGGANNQLSDAVDGRMLHERGILYLPDFIINAGGVIFLTHGLRGRSRAESLEETKNIYHTLKNLIEISKREKIATSEAALMLARRRLAQDKNSFSHQQA